MLSDGTKKEPSLRSALLSRISLLILNTGFVLTLTAGTLMVLRMNKEIRNKNQAIADGANYLIQQNLDSSLNSLSRALELLAVADEGGNYLLQTRDKDGALIRMLLSGLVQNGSFQAVKLVQGNTIQHSFPDTSIIGFTISPIKIKDYIDAKPYRGRVFMSRVGSPSLEVAVSQGNLSLVGEINLKWLTDFASELSFGETGNASIADCDGVLIAHPDAELVARRLNISHLSIFKKTAVSGHASGYFSFSEASRLGVGVRIPEWGWTLIISQSVSETLASVWQILIILVLGLGILAFLTYSAINAYIKQLIAPLDALIEGARRSANGDYRALENMASSYTEIHSLIFEFSTMARTIANRELDLNEKQENIKRSLAEKEILIKEIHHRVKNNLQIVSSLLSLQRNEIMDPDIAILFAESEKRVGAMAIVHEHLYSSDNLSSIDFLIYLNDLSSSLASSVGTQWLIQGDQITLTIDKAIPCALAVNELMMNSVKHSWTALRPGHFTITAKNENKEIIVTIADDGPGLPANFSPDSDSGLGLEIVNALASQLKGRLLWGNGQNGGARFELRFPEE